MHSHLIFACACLTALAFGADGASAAEPTYPTKPIRLLVAAAPGGPNDLIARIIAQPWAEGLGGTIVVDNRAGATGLIGTETVARSTPDGYTLLVGYPGPLIISPLLGEKTGYDSLRDFAPISLAVSSPFVLLINPNITDSSNHRVLKIEK